MRVISRRGSDCLPAHAGHVTALAFSKCTVLGRQWRGVRCPAVCHGAVATAGSHILAYPAGCLGSICSLRHFSHATRAEHLLPLQCPPAVVIFRGRLHSGPNEHSDRTIHVTRSGEPIYMVPEATRQSSDWQSIHFLVLVGYVAFIIAHVSMVVLSGFARNMNHIVMSKDDSGLTGAYLGLLGLGILVAANVFANWASWKRSRTVQHFSEAVLNPIFSLLLDRLLATYRVYRGGHFAVLLDQRKRPVSDEWKALVTDGFAGYRLKVYGLVENPVELSLEDIHAMSKKTQITLHNCIQGWSGIAA
jgi:hypothetical protein